MKSKSILILVAICGLLFSGCGTLPPTQQRHVVTTTKLAAFIGTFEAVRQHPEWRSGFGEAAVELQALEAANTIDAATLLAIVRRLPVKELKGDRATLIITSATILLSDYAGSLSLDQIQELKPIAAAIREGIQLGLGP